MTFPGVPHSVLRAVSLLCATIVTAQAQESPDFKPVYFDTRNSAFIFFVDSNSMGGEGTHWGAVKDGKREFLFPIDDSGSDLNPGQRLYPPGSPLMKKLRTFQGQREFAFLDQVEDVLKHQKDFLQIPPGACASIVNADRDEMERELQASNEAAIAEGHPRGIPSDDVFPTRVFDGCHTAPTGDVLLLSKSTFYGFEGLNWSIEWRFYSKQELITRHVESRRLNDLGFDAYKSKKYKEAIGFFEKAKTADPDNLNAILNLASTYVVMGRADLAMEELLLATQINPEMATKRIISDADFQSILHERGVPEVLGIRERPPSATPDASMNAGNVAVTSGESPRNKLEDPKFQSATEAAARDQAARADDAAWVQAQQGGDWASYQQYITSFPGGRYRAAATLRLSRLRPVEPFKDCPDCPEMVVIPAGSYKMGSPPGEPGRFRNEGPQHAVRVSAFALGKYAVTQKQWRALMGEEGIGYDDCDDCPANLVTWDKAQEFVRRLSEKAGKPYRLPTEAEWEYACRSGSYQLYCGSDDASAVAWSREGNELGQYSWVHPVGRLEPNAWGLYGMSGSVWQWTQDCYHEDYSGAPVDGSAWVQVDCPDRVQRGGSPASSLRGVRAASRLQQEHSEESRLSGLRVATGARLEGFPGVER